MQKLEYLGHIITPSSITVYLKKTKDIDKCKLPTNIKESQMLFSICNYYANFML